MISKNYRSSYDVLKTLVVTFTRPTALLIVGFLLLFSLPNPLHASTITSQLDYSDSYGAGTLESHLENFATGISANLGSITVAFEESNCALGNRIVLNISNGMGDQYYPKFTAGGSTDYLYYTCTGSGGIVFKTYSFEFSGPYGSTSNSTTGRPITANCGIFSSNNCPWNFNLFRNNGGDHFELFGETGISSGGGAYFIAETDYVLPTCSDGIQNQDETAIDFGGICPEIETVSANITTSTIWDRSHLYLISGDIEITTGDTLTIEPGTIVKFDTATPSSLTVNGILVAEGDLGSEQSLGRIIFTSLKDDSLLGLDTNSDGNSTSPTGGDWGGITIGSGGSVSFDRVVLRYAGATGTTEAQIYNDGGTLAIENSDIVHGTTYGIYNDSGTSDIFDSELGYNDYGFYLNGGTADVTPNNTIHDNSLYGIYNDTVSSIDAEDNYWGDPTGPYHDSSNLSGLGNEVSDYVDFTPWDSNRHYILNEEDEEYCEDYNECTSIYDDELQWKNVDAGSYSTEISSALSTWGALGNVTMTQDNSTPALEFYKIDRDDVSWKGSWDPEQTPDKVNLNSYYLDNSTSNQIQNTITHELGHALGLGHSYTGNIMYFNQTPQTSLGSQDESDYNLLWP